jgi:integrase/recombinase XerC
MPGCRRSAPCSRYTSLHGLESGTRELAAPSVKQRLAAIRHLYDWLVTGQVVPVNPAGSVRGPRHIVTSGQTPVLDPSEARALLDSIDTASVVGLRDRALIGLMVYSFARIGAALGMTVEDVFTQNRRLWVRLREKGGKRHAIPCHHNLEEYLTGYLDGAGLRDDPKGPLFRTIGRGTGKLTRTVLPQANANAMIRPRAAPGSKRSSATTASGRPGSPLTSKRRHARKGCSDGKPRLDAHDAALRSPAGRAQPR